MSAFPFGCICVVTYVSSPFIRRLTRPILPPFFYYPDYNLYKRPASVYLSRIQQAFYYPGLYISVQRAYRAVSVQRARNFLCSIIQRSRTALSHAPTHNYVRSCKAVRYNYIASHLTAICIAIYRPHCLGLQHSNSCVGFNTRTRTCIYACTRYI